MWFFLKLSSTMTSPTVWKPESRIPSATLDVCCHSGGFIFLHVPAFHNFTALCKKWLIEHVSNSIYEGWIINEARRKTSPPAPSALERAHNGARWGALSWAAGQVWSVRALMCNSRPKPRVHPYEAGGRHGSHIDLLGVSQRRRAQRRGGTRWRH